MSSAIFKFYARKDQTSGAKKTVELANPDLGAAGVVTDLVPWKP
jgi:hypothetical protein